MFRSMGTLYRRSLRPRDVYEAESTVYEGLSGIRILQMVDLTGQGQCRVLLRETSDDIGWAGSAVPPVVRPTHHIFIIHYCHVKALCYTILES
jgi:hypothetical protein